MPTLSLVEMDVMLAEVHTLPDRRKGDVGTCTSQLARSICS